jgi:hypothetical protein
VDLDGVVYNFRFWVPLASGTAINSPHASLQFIPSGVWTPNFAFPSGAGQSIPFSLPDGPNLSRIDGGVSITGYSAAQTTQYIYLRLFLDANFPTGNFGICGSGLLRPVLSFDFY